MKKIFCLLALGMALAVGGAHAASDQQTKMKTCNAEAGNKALKGDERKAFMKECLSAKPETAASPQTKMKTCNAEAGTKALKGDERKAFMKECLSAK